MFGCMFLWNVMMVIGMFLVGSVFLIRGLFVWVSSSMWRLVFVLVWIWVWMVWVVLGLRSCLFMRVLGVLSSYVLAVVLVLGLNVIVDYWCVEENVIWVMGFIVGMVVKGLCRAVVVGFMFGFVLN